MNEIYIMGKLVNVKYFFIYKGKNTSFAKGYIEDNKQIIPIIAIDKIADKMYVNNNKLVITNGSFFNNKIIIKEIESI